MIRSLAISGLLACAAPVVHALDVASADFKYVSELLAADYTPFGTGGAARDLFGMSNGAEIYLCFLLDTPEDQAVRQAALIAELNGPAPSRTIPNIPVVCVLTQ